MMGIKICGSLELIDCMNKSDAVLLINNFLKNLEVGISDDSYVIVDEMTLEKCYGWVFWFNSKKYIETGNFIYSLGGNGPLVVLKDAGRIYQLSSAISSDLAIMEFEKNMGFSK